MPILLRGPVVGKKNWLFFGSHDGGRAAAVIYTIVVTARNHGVGIDAYLRWHMAHLARREWSVAAARALLPDRFRDEVAKHPTCS